MKHFFYNLPYDIVRKLIPELELPLWDQNRTEKWMTDLTSRDARMIMRLKLARPTAKTEKRYYIRGTMEFPWMIFAEVNEFNNKKQSKWFDSNQ